MSSFVAVTQTLTTPGFRRTHSLALMTLSLLLVAASASAQDTTGVGAISGVVVNAAGQPAAGVRVCALDTSACATSDARGTFRIGELRASAMADIDTTDRSRLAEDEYFRRKDAEILHRAGEAERVARERAALAEALGALDPEACDQLHTCGLRASTTALVEWFPAVEVAWLDGADEAERHALRVHFNVDDRASAEGMALLDGWLIQRPPDELFAAGRRALRARLLTLGADEREALLARVLALCEATGRAAGGCFGLGALSSDERSHISVIQGDLRRPL